MAWNDLCGGKLVNGKAIDLKTLIGVDVDHNKRGKTDLPNATALGNMVRAADKLKLKEGSGKGISFTIAEGTIAADNSVNAAQKYKNFVNTKDGAGVCYEDSILPLGTIGPGHVLVHQSVAPCKRCRAGYKAWAKQLSATIVISADDGYDGAPDNTTFIFAPTGLVFYG
jgi:hypothetical protein